MKKLNKLIFFIFISALLLIAACSGEDNDDDNSLATGTKDSAKSADIKPTGGEKLISVRAEYSFSYDNGDYDPTLRYTYLEDITYKECKEWQLKENGASNTHFYATFSGGVPTKVGRTANEYYMVVNYGDGLTQKSDPRVIFKDYPDDMRIHAEGECYPKGTIEVYDMNDKIMGKMSFDNTNN